jgi:DNA-binding PadR family transcriptional regulator
MKTGELVKGTTGMLVLRLLAATPMHGYEIIRKMEALSEGVFSLKEGTLYPVLHALEAEELLEAVWEGETDRKRKVYHVTKKGLNRLREKHAEWETVKGAVDRIMGVVQYA